MNASCFKRGDVVKTAKWVKPARFANRVGTVIIPDNEGEVGVDLQHDQKTTAWFYPRELERVDAMLLHADGDPA